ncbi:MAG TPA: hypothetical protein VGM67_18455 [Gemmatimonadaceae bacterium]|jgi:hypothetical protein
MKIDELPDTQSPLSESTDAQRAGRVGARLAAGVFGLASCIGIAAVYYRHLDGGGSILHPSHAMLRSMSIAVTAIVGTVLSSWVAVTNRRWWERD